MTEMLENDYLCIINNIAMQPDKAEIHRLINASQDEWVLTQVYELLTAQSLHPLPAEHIPALQEAKAEISLTPPTLTWEQVKVHARR